MLWTILAILLVLWLVGLVAKVGGGLIHLLLVVALIVFIINCLTDARLNFCVALLVFPVRCGLTKQLDRHARKRDFR